MEAKKILSQKQAITFFDCSRTHLHRLEKAGKIKPKYLGRKPYYNIDEVEKAMTEEPETLTT